MHALNLTINEGIAMPTYSAVSVTTSLANSIMMYSIIVGCFYIATIYHNIMVERPG